MFVRGMGGSGLVRFGSPWRGPFNFYRGTLGLGDVGRGKHRRVVFVSGRIWQDLVFNRRLSAKEFL